MYFTEIQIPFTENKRKNVRCDNVDEKISSRKCLTVFLKSLDVTGRSTVR